MADIEAVGLVGGMTSGKNTFGDFIASHHDGGAVVVTTSDVARAYIDEKNLGEPTRDLTREVACDLRAQRGADFLLRQSVELAEEEVGAEGLIIVSGLYVPPEVIALRGLKKGPIVHVEASQTVREERSVQRSRSNDESDRTQFKRLDEEDMNASVTDQRLKDVIAMADFSVDGAISLEDQEYWSEQMERVLAW